MNEIMFSIVLIARNEEKTLPRLLESLKEYRDRGGEICLLDTGSTDTTVQIAREAGCVVETVGEKYLHKIDKHLAAKINKKFIIGNEEPVVEEGDSYFDFSTARNHVAQLAKNDVIFSYDADEVAAKLDIDAVNNFIKEGLQQFEYNFVFSKDAHGNEAVKFVQSKAYDRRVLAWNGIIHEVLLPITPKKEVKRVFLPEDLYKLEHYQNEETGRHTYLKGLAVDCFNNPSNDRHSHYLGREMMWNGRPKSAIKEFKRHVSMNGWKPEKAESQMFIGDCYGMINLPEQQVEYYYAAFHTDDTRREALLRLGGYYLHHKKFQAAVCFAKASLEIPLIEGLYMTQLARYTYEPHEILFRAYGWIGNIPAAQFHILECLKYQPANEGWLSELNFYFDEQEVEDIKYRLAGGEVGDVRAKKEDFELPTVDFVIPQLGREEGLQKCIDSIRNLDYPQELIEIIIEEGDDTVPVKVNRGYKKGHSDIIVYAANDVEFEENSLKFAVQETDKFGLVAFNTGDVYPDKGNICEHFLVRRDFVEEELGGEIFDEELHHVGVDNLLWAKSEKVGKATRCSRAIVHHYHFSKEGGQMDEVYEKGWKNRDSDRKLLADKLVSL